jgi:hypothetical protein
MKKAALFYLWLHAVDPIGPTTTVSTSDSSDSLAAIFKPLLPVYLGVSTSTSDQGALRGLK